MIDALAAPDAPAAALLATVLAKVARANTGSAAPRPVAERAGDRDSSAIREDGTDRKRDDGAGGDTECSVSSEASARGRSSVCAANTREATATTPVIRRVTACWRFARVRELRENDREADGITLRVPASFLMSLLRTMRQPSAHIRPERYTRLREVFRSHDAADCRRIF